MSTRPGSRPWLISTVVCGLLLVIAVVIALNASVSRLGRTMELLDKPGTHSGDLGRLMEDSTRTTRLSLFAGAPVAVLYLTSLYMYRRSRKSPA
jgi:hypothetical protein